MYSLTLLLLAIFTLYIAAFGFVHWDSAFLREGDTPLVQILLIFIAVLFLFYGLSLAYGWLKQSKKRTQKICAGVFLGIILAGQLTFLLYFQPSLRYDALKTFDQAVEMLSTHTISETYESGYFARYTNNYPITILTYWLLSLASSLGLPAKYFMLFVQLLNIVLLDVSLLLGAQILKKLYKGSSIPLFYLLLCAVCPITYVWSGFYYTSTLAMPFFMGALLLFLHIRESFHADTSASFTPQSKKAKTVAFTQSALCGFLLGFLILMGYKFRATTVIVLIAILIAALYEIPWRSFFRQKKTGGSGLSGLSSWLQTKGKALAVTLLSFFLACVLTLGFWSAAVSHYVKFDYKNTGFPAIHWVMMGMRWDGAFDQSDEQYTFSFPTKEEKVAADKELLLERIQEAGPTGLVSLMGRKLLNTWVDGTDTYEAENSAIRYGNRYGRIYDYLLGNKDGLLVIYAQAFRVLQMLVLGISSSLLLLKKWKRKEKPSPCFALQLALLGGMAFHLIWETNPLYSIGFAFLGMVLMAEQLCFLWQNRNTWGRVLCPLSFLCLLILLLFGKKQLVETPIEEKLYCALQYQYNDETRTYVQEYEEIYTQTFTTDQPFNRLAIHALNPVGEYNQSAFCVEIKDEQGNVVYSNDRFLSGMVEKNKLYEFAFDMVVPNGPTTYTITLSPGYIHGEDSLQFLYYCTENEDLYPDGTMTIAGEEQKNGDLAFAVYEYQVTTYFNLKVYLLLSLLLILGCGGISLYIWRQK